MAVDKPADNAVGEVVDGVRRVRLLLVLTKPLFLLSLQRPRLLAAAAGVEAAVLAEGMREAVPEAEVRAGLLPPQSRRPSECRLHPQLQRLLHVQHLWPLHPHILLPSNPCLMVGFRLSPPVLNLIHLKWISTSQRNWILQSKSGVTRLGPKRSPIPKIPGVQRLCLTTGPGSTVQAAFGIPNGPRMKSRLLVLNLLPRRRLTRPRPVAERESRLRFLVALP